MRKHWWDRWSIGVMFGSLVMALLVKFDLRNTISLRADEIKKAKVVEIAISDNSNFSNPRIDTIIQIPLSASTAFQQHFRGMIEKREIKVVNTNVLFENSPTFAKLKSR